jgi:Asp-tRNA(Asn)/Glu-tRNA(Gln) amidotransferase A subunit family amidase
MPSKPSRRRIVKAALALAVAGTAKAAPSTAATSPASTKADTLSAHDMAVFERLTGRSYTEPEREMMTAGVADMRQTLKRVRAGRISPDVEPALHFDPRPSGFAMPKVEPTFTPTKPDVAYDGKLESLAFATVAELSALIAARKVTSTQLTKVYLERLKRIGPGLKCVVTLTEDLALKQAARADEEIKAGKIRGPLHGIPWGAKDLLATKGIRTTWGAKPYIDQVFDEDADVVKRLEAAGAVLVAKLSLGELAMGDVWFGGKTRNPWKPSEGSSGSSAGPASATAAGLVGFSIGSETLGSIVSPSVTCGVTGLRTTYGAVSRHGAMPLARSMDKLGPMCRCVEDCALVYQAIRNADVPFGWEPGKSLKGLRVGIIQSAFDGVKDAKRKALYDAALDALRGVAGPLIPVTLPPAEPYRGLTSLTIGAESASSFSELLDSGEVRELKQQASGSWPNTFRIGTTIPAADYLRAQQRRTMLIEEMATALKNVDCYVTVPYAGQTLAFTNLSGHPTLIARCGVIDGRPISIEFVGQLYREDVICRVGRTVEQVVSPKSRWPDEATIMGAVGA